MKNNNPTVLIILSFLIGLITNVHAQVSPLMRLEEVGGQQKVFRSLTKILEESVGSDIRVFPSDNQQSEESISLNPINPVNLLIGANTKIGTDFRQGYYYSSNNGFSWTGGDNLPDINFNASDPALAFDNNGNAYFNFIERECDDCSYVLKVKKSTNGGMNWQPAVEIPNVGNPDKNHLAIDLSNGVYSNYIYVAYTNFTGSSLGNIQYSRSTNGGTTFSGPMNISGNGAANGQFSQGVNLTVGLNGEIYASWAIQDEWPPTSELCNPVAEWGSDAIGFTKSTNAGINWQIPPTRIYEIEGSRDWWCDKNPDGEISPIRMNDFPVMAIDKSGGSYHGSVYLVWGAKGMNNDRADILFGKSTNGGLSWSQPSRVNNDNTITDQWFPWITVGQDGVISIIFYDSRNDPINNQLT